MSLQFNQEAPQQGGFYLTCFNEPPAISIRIDRVIYDAASLGQAAQDLRSLAEYLEDQRSRFTQ